MRKLRFILFFSLLSNLHTISRSLILLQPPAISSAPLSLVHFRSWFVAFGHQFFVSAPLFSNFAALFSLFLPLPNKGILSTLWGGKYFAEFSSFSLHFHLLRITVAKGVSHWNEVSFKGSQAYSSLSNFDVISSSKLTRGQHFRHWFCDDNTLELLLFLPSRSLFLSFLLLSLLLLFTHHKCSLCDKKCSLTQWSKRVQWQC